MNNQVLIIVFFTLILIQTGVFYILGKKALSIFPDLMTHDILFSEKWASGKSNKSLITQMANAQNVLDVVITHEELWIKAPLLIAGIGNMYDLIHKIQLKDIKNVEYKRNDLVIHFVRESGENAEVLLRLKKHKEFVEIIKPLT